MWCGDDDPCDVDASLYDDVLGSELPPQMSEEKMLQKNFVDVCKSGDAAQVRHMLNAGLTPMAVGIWGETALHAAASAGHVDVVRTLLEYGANVNALNEAGNTPFLSAIGGSADAELLAVLEAAGSDVTVMGAGHNWALDVASRYGNVAAVQYLLARGYTQVRTDDESPLHVACENGHTEVVAMLLCANITDVEAPDKFGLSPLHRACFWSRVETTELLIRHGAVLTDKVKRTWNWGRGTVPTSVLHVHHEMEKKMLERAAAYQHCALANLLLAAR